MIWSCYDVGSQVTRRLCHSYSLFRKVWHEDSLIAFRNFDRENGSSGNKKVDIGFLANEVYFAMEGVYDFAAPEWGRQDL